VEAGAVLGGLCARADAGHHRPALADWLESVSGERVPPSLIDPHRTPMDGLYLCGAGCHPGGGVMGIAGRNAAQQVLRGGK
nr:exodeoxyribonuclease V subunit alpha [Arenimonas sp.]